MFIFMYRKLQHDRRCKTATGCSTIESETGECGMIADRNKSAAALLCSPQIPHRLQRMQIKGTQTAQTVFFVDLIFRIFRRKNEHGNDRMVKLILHFSPLK
jgi:hypothetical protein